MASFGTVNGPEGPRVLPAILTPPRHRQALAVTMGEPAGIGTEIALAAWQARRTNGVPPFFLIADPDAVAAMAKRLRWDVPLTVLDSSGDAAERFADALPIIAEPLAAPVVAGRPDPAHAPAVIASIERAVALTSSGQAAAMVTLPIQKATLYEAGFAHPGHTEFLAALAGPGVTPVMMLVVPGLRTVPVTIHIPLAQVPGALTAGAIIQAGRITAAALQGDFGIARPLLAVAGLNPHAGENGALGREDIEVIEPALSRLRAEGLAVQGPQPADTMFHAAARRHYDAALCMYHDQALIPAKTLGFEDGVNATLGLPFVRTSPDHGTALDIAGQGKATAQSLISALRLADQMATHRARYAARHIA